MIIIMIKLNVIFISNVVAFCIEKMNMYFLKKGFKFMFQM